MSQRRSVITGFGLVSPLGLNPDDVWDRLIGEQSGLSRLDEPPADLPVDALGVSVGGVAREFTGHIDEFGELEPGLKKTVRKGRKLMCREIAMGVAASQRALLDAQMDSAVVPPERIGTMFGCDYIMTNPQEFSSGMMQCTSGGQFEYDAWAENGLPKVEPLWLLKYLPNMPASHVAIYNDLRGPSNSITVRECSSNLAIGEACTTIGRSIADVILAGATGSRIMPMRAMNTSMQENLCKSTDPATASCPFDKRHQGGVIGEGSAMLVIEEQSLAMSRGAKIWGEVLGTSSSTVYRGGQPDFQTALTNAATMALRNAGLKPNEIDHVHAHGLSDPVVDESEAAAIFSLFGGDTPVITSKGHTGNLGAGGGGFEIVASLLACHHGTLFPVLNFNRLGVSSKINVQTADNLSPPGQTFVNLNVTPQGQASAAVIRAETAM